MYFIVIRPKIILLFVTDNKIGTDMIEWYNE